jgi:uncharacterized lipoprotein
MKKTILFPLLLAFVVTLIGCVTDHGKFPEPTANFMPKRIYTVQYDKLWQVTLDALDKNNITVVSTDKSSGIIQTDYIAGPAKPLIVEWENIRYKYNVTLRSEPDGSVKVNVVCRIEDSLFNGKDSTQWSDVTQQNVPLENKLETWLYEQLEDELNAS